QCHFRKSDALDLQTLQKMFGEMQSCRWGRHGPLVLGIDGLVAILVLWLHTSLDVFGERGLPEFTEFSSKIRIGPIVEKTEGPAPGSGIVDHLGHKALIVPKIKLVPDPDLPRGVHQNVPKPLLLVQFPEQKDLDAGPGLFLVPK